MQEYFKPVTSHLVYRSQIRQSKQKGTKSVAEFMAGLKDLAEKFKLADMDEPV